MQVATIMRRNPVVVEPELGVEAARELMLTEDIRHLPVVRQGDLVGVVSDRDLFPIDEELRGPSPRRGARPVRCVADVMCTELVLARPDDTLVSAAVAFLVRRVGCLPVVQDGDLVGILSEMDMLTAYVDLVRRGVLVDRSDLAEVADLMTEDPVTATPLLPASDARKLMRSVHARHLPVVDGQRLVGIVSDRDLRRVEAAGEAGEWQLSHCMQREPLTVGPATRGAEAAALMVTAKISALPVVADGELVGIVTLTDLLEHCLGSLREPERARTTPRQEEAG